MNALVESIQRVASQFDVQTTDNQHLSLQLAETLGWNKSEPTDYQARDENNPSPIGMTRTFIGPQPATLFAASTDSFSQKLLNSTAFYAYHASISWGLIATKEGIMIFNSHWLKNNEWFHLPVIEWADVDRNISVFEAITPEGVRKNSIARLATAVTEPDKILRTVDDALVDRLNNWREETLKYSEFIENVDETLQTLFAQLFVLRVTEDRYLAPDIPSLRTIYNSYKKVDLPGLYSVLEQARDVIGSDLFEEDALRCIPENVLGGIIHDLYTPYNLPTQNLRYNFSWIDADVLGLAYEKYLSTVLAPLPRPAQTQLNFFEQSPVREIQPITVRKSTGVYYTPDYVVQYLTESCLSELDIRPNNIPRIGDFACGSGSFLVASINSLILRLRQYDPDKNWARELVDGRYVIGIDIDRRAVTMTRLSLWLRFTEEPHPLPLPRLEEIVVCGDSLSDSSWESIPKNYDVILGNPPFLATKWAPNKDELAAKFRAAQGRYDYSYLFLELALRHLSQKGLIGMVIPNRLFTNRDADIIRELLTTETNIISVADFGTNEVFEGTSAYVCAIVAHKSDTYSDSVRVINVKNLSPPFMTALLLSASDVEEEEIENESLVAYNSDPHPRGQSPWLLVAPKDKRLRTYLEDESELLGSIAGIYQGIRTGANDIFVVNLLSGYEGELVQVINRFGEQGIVEKALLHPVAFGSDIKKNELVTAVNYLIYPYRNNAVIQEAELKEKYTHTYKYLLRYKNALVGRASIKSSSLKWYELVRKRDSDWLSQPKLLIRDLALETSFSLDQWGSNYLVGGTAVVPFDSDIMLPLLSYLNSQLVNQYIKQVTPSFRGGFQKFEPQHLQRIPVLKRVLDHDDELSSLLGYEALTMLEARNEGDEQKYINAVTAVEDGLAQSIDLDELMS